MKRFTNQDIENYYDQTEVHYRMHWNLEEGMGLHYGVWDEDTKTLAESVLNSNFRLMNLGEIKSSDRVLDAGCGIGGSSIYLAINKGCRVEGITLSAKQVETATALAAKKGVGDKVHFSRQDYTDTSFPENTFDIAWCIESMETADNKAAYFREMGRILKPGGKILIADIFKPEGYDMSKEKDMQTMLNGWAMSDILSLEELHQMAEEHNFKVTKLDDVSKNVEKSVKRMYLASLAGAVGTWAYNLFYNASHFSKIHYKTGLAQIKGYKARKWGYYMVCIENKK